MSKGDHFYTVSESERDFAIAHIGYVGEGIACAAFGSQTANTVPLHRLFNTHSGDHFYTTSNAERDRAIASFSYQSEGIACFVFDTAVPGTVPLHRLFNAQNGDHFYTTSDIERDSAIVNSGFQSEGIACFVLPPGTPRALSLHRLYKRFHAPVKTSFRPQTDGFAFHNHWHFDDVERDEIRRQIAAGLPLAVGVLTPIIMPLLGPGIAIADLIGAIFGIPPGTAELVAAAAIAVKLKDFIDQTLNESYGLCGGMAFTTMDYFMQAWIIARGFPDGPKINDSEFASHGQPDRQTPEGAALRTYIYDRLIDSFKNGVMKTTLEWMAILNFIPEDAGGGAPELLKRSIIEFARLKEKIDSGTPWPIGLIGTTNNPSKNHQILAYGYDDPGDGTGAILVYDNNCPDEEGYIEIDFRNDKLSASESCPSENRGELRGFFCEPYTSKVPPIAVGMAESLTSNPAGSVALGQPIALTFGVKNLGYGETSPLALTVNGTLLNDSGTQIDHIPPPSSRQSLSGNAARTINPPLNMKVDIPGLWQFSARASLGTVTGAEIVKTFPNIELGLTPAVDIIVFAPTGLGDHFYTTSVEERDRAMANFGYQDEGIACEVFSHVFDTPPVPGTVPLFRLFKLDNGDHFYTTSEAERDRALASFGYQDEGIACEVFSHVFDTPPVPGTVPLFRLFKLENGDHFYTTSGVERDRAIASFGYQDEGIACEVFPHVFDTPSSSGTVPFFRLLKIA